MKTFKERVIVIGSLNTDLIGFGVEQLLKKGELTLGGELIIAPGGKSRNIAEMISCLGLKNSVSMISLTSKDPFGLWKVPFEALKKVGVSTDFIEVADFNSTGKYPGLALIPVDKKGSNQIYVLPGISSDFSPQHVLAAESAFSSAKKGKSLVTLTLEMPLETAIFSIRLARKYGLKVILDPGGVDPNENYEALLDEEIFLLKPNEHEVKILTGINVVDLESAKKAAKILLEKEIKNILITAGKEGAYFFNKSESFKIHPLKIDSIVRDETGCGDQVTATLCAMLLKGVDLTDAVKVAVKSGGLQFQKPGVCPITLSELEASFGSF